MRINVNVVRRIAYGTRTDLFKQEPVVVSSFFRLAPRTPLNPPMAASATVYASVIQAKLAAIQIHQVEIVPAPASQPGKATVIPPAIRIKHVGIVPAQSGVDRRDHRIMKANRAPRLYSPCYPACSFYGQSFPVVRGEVHVFPVTKQNRGGKVDYQPSLRDHRQPEVARG